jgi:peroxiredoxin
VLESQKELFSSKKARVVSVNLDEPPRAKVVKGFAAQQNFTFPIVMNKTEEKSYDIDKSYLVKGTPVSYLIDSKGIIVDSHYGPLGPQDLQTALDKLP